MTTFTPEQEAGGKESFRIPGADITNPIPTQKIIPNPDDDPCGHLAECEWCDECEALMNFYMACDFCGHWGHMESDGWFLGHLDEHGRAQVYCSEECCANNGDTLADNER